MVPAGEPLPQWRTHAAGHQRRRGWDRLPCSPQRILDKTNGWQFYLLTEDIEFSVRHITDGEIIAICEDAVLYDEQPTDFRQSWRQRLRWAKGYIQVFQKYGGKLLKGAARGS